MTRHYHVNLAEVGDAWKSVRKAGGACGYDGQTISDIEKNLENNLFKIWNRMSSGCYMASPVLLVDIPKARGGVRQLGIPTVSDRIAQTVIKNRLESILEDQFMSDSYAYRPNKSAIDAVTVCRERCFKHEWVIEIDIKGFFDNLDHDIMMNIVSDYTDDKVILLYAKRFLKAEGVKSMNGRREERQERGRGTPQGGVVSPILANLYLHVAFDKWIEEEYKSAVKFERYADDIIVHCKSEEEANLIKDQIKARLNEYKLELHPEKTKVVYTGAKNDHDHRGHDLPRKFAFLGYDFKPRMANGGKIVFTPGIGAGALKMIGDKIRKGWQLTKKYATKGLGEVAEMANPIIRGWINYYGHHRRSELYKLAEMIDRQLTKFIKKKYKQSNTYNKAWKQLKRTKAEAKTLFCHWYMIRQT